MKKDISRRNFLKTATVAAGTGAIVAALPLSLHAETLKQPQKWDIETDVVVAGGGIAGCMAAIEAAAKGCKVILLQATPDLGGNSAISSGWIRSCNTKWHKERNIQDTTEEYIKDGLEYGRGTRDEAKLKVIAEKSAPFVDRLISYGVKFTDDKDVINGGKTLRVVKTDGTGAALMKQVKEVVYKTKGIEVKTEAKLIDIYKTTAPDILTGIKAEIEEEDVNIKCKALIVATGGFGRDQNMVTKYVNQWKETFRIMDVEDKGDGLKIATSHGAGSANLQVAMVCPTMEYTKKIFYSSAPILEGSIFVNQNGDRFVNEYVIYTDTPSAMLKQEKVFQILCEGLHPQVEKMKNDGVMTKADTIEELAKNIGVPLNNVKKEIEEHNKITASKGQRKDRFGRIAFNKELKAPFYTMRIWPVMIETTGGIFINEKAEIINFAGKPVMKGLYGAGAVAFGEHFGVGYRSGDAYVYSGVFGMVSGEEAAKYTKS